MTFLLLFLSILFGQSYSILSFPVSLSPSDLYFFTISFNMFCFSIFQYKFSFHVIDNIFFAQFMPEDIQIVDLTGSTREEILRQILKILEQSQIDRFTLLIKRTKVDNPHHHPELTQRINQLLGQSNRHKSSTIDRFYRTSMFASGKKSMPPSDSQTQDILQDSDLPESPKQLGIKLYSQGQYQDAANILFQVKQQFPLDLQQQFYLKQYRQILIYLGNSHFHLQAYQKAIDIYKQLLKDSEDEDFKASRAKGQLLNNLGCCYGKLGCQKLSMNAYSQALKIYQKYPEIDCSPLLANVANIYYNCKMFSVAQKYYQQAINERTHKRPNQKQLLYHVHQKLGLTQIEQGKFMEAQGNYDKALKLALYGYGNVIQILKQSARLKQMGQKWEEALQFYQKLHECFQKQGMFKGFIFQKVSMIYLRLGKFIEQGKYIRLALQQYVKAGDTRKISQISNKKSVIQHMVV